MTTLPIDSIDGLSEFSQLSVYGLLRELLHVVNIRELSIQTLSECCMDRFYFLSKQFISDLEISIKFVSLICYTLLNHFNLAVDNFEVLEVFLIRYHHILKSVHHTNGNVVPFVWVQDLQLVLQSTQLSLILESLL